MVVVGNRKLQNALLKLQDPAPQYVLGCLPAIGTIGATPYDGLAYKILWVLRCLGCPFAGLFYFCNIGKDEIAMSTYWLAASSFVRERDEKLTDLHRKEKDGDKLTSSSLEGGKEDDFIPYRPFGHHAMELCLTPEQEHLMRGCIAEASVLDRLSSLVSAYHILVGIFSGVSRVFGECRNEDWSYIPMVLAWTLPAIYMRVVGGRMAFIDPRQILGSRIKVRPFRPGMRNTLAVHVMFTAVATIACPWISVIMTYLTPPVGFGCRSRYITVFCSIWSFNSFIAYISHVKGEKTVDSGEAINRLFCISGVVIVGLLAFLGLLSNQASWWIDIFGNSCDISGACS